MKIHFDNDDDNDDGPQQSSSFCLTKEDEYDICFSFDCLDDNRSGKLNMDQCYQLFLGLGYPFMEKEEFAKQIQRETALGDGAPSEERIIDVETVLKIASKYSRNSSSSAELEKSFRLVAPDDAMNAQDLIHLAKEVGETLTLDQAEEMLKGRKGKLCLADIHGLFSKPTSSRLS